MPLSRDEWIDAYEELEAKLATKDEEIRRLKGQVRCKCPRGPQGEHLSDCIYDDLLGGDPLQVERRRADKAEQALPAELERLAEEWEKRAERSRAFGGTSADEQAVAHALQAEQERISSHLRELLRSFT